MYYTKYNYFCRHSNCFDNNRNVQKGYKFRNAHIAYTTILYLDIYIYLAEAKWSYVHKARYPLEKKIIGFENISHNWIV